MGARRPFDLALIAALGPAPAPPVRTSERAHSGKVRGVTIWTEPIKDRLRRAHAIGAEEGVIAAFPDWDYHALRCAVVRYVGITGEPARFEPDEFRRRLAAIPADQLLERVHSLMLWGPLSARQSSAGGPERRAA
jgi:hypothetical protein